MISVLPKGKEVAKNPLMMLLQGSKDTKNSPFAALLKHLQVKNPKDVGIKDVVLKDETADTKLKPILLKLDPKLAKDETPKVEVPTKSQNITLQDLLNKTTIKAEVSEQKLDLPLSEVKVTLLEAKTKLKQLIENSPEYKSSKLKELPNNIGSLLKIAKEFKLDISTIKLESLSQKVVLEQPKPQQTFATQQILSTTQELKNEPEVKKQKPNTLSSLLSQKTKDEPIVEKKPTQKPLIVKQTPQESKDEQVKQVATKVEVPTKSEPLRNLLVTKDEPVVQKSVVEKPTQEVQKHIEPSNNKEMLKALLSSSSDMQQDANHQQSSQRNDMQILEVNQKDTSSLDVKINEAKQMLKYLSEDIKKAIDDYKPPISRIKVQLNPAKLGEMELSVTQRGKNIYVSLTSNNTAINLLHSNLGELRVQLANSGINNATFNFSSTTSDGGSGFFQNQKEQHKQGHKEYSYFSKDELEDEEVLDSLEIVLPKYA